MEDARFDRFVRAVAGVTSRRGLLGIAASLPVVGSGGLLREDAEAKRRQKRRKARGRKDERDDVQDEKHRKKGKVTLCLNDATIRVSKSKKKKFLKQGATAGACVPPPDCGPEPKTTTCAGKCGPQTNNCKQAVDCGSCDCPAPCDECFICEGSPGECVPEAFNTPCGTGPSCSNGFAVPGDFCEGTGTCVSPSPFPCQPYLCAGDTCGNTCTDDNDCDPAAFCDSENQCTYKLPLGSTCEEDGDCISNACCGDACQECCENSECTGGNICGPNFTCIAPCSGSNPCNASQLCIEGICHDCTVLPFVGIDPLQTAINDADSGDTLYVCAGSYTSQISAFEIKKSIAIIGAGDDPSGTVLAHRLDVFQETDLPDVTLSNMLIQGQGVGINLQDATLTMNSCTVSQSGRGIDKTGGSLVMNDCKVLNNTSAPEGAGIRNTNGPVVLNDCLIQGNSANNGGGGILTQHQSAQSSSLTLNNTVVRNNTTVAGLGSGILNVQSRSVVNISDDSEICENTPLANQCEDVPQGQCSELCSN